MPVAQVLSHFLVVGYVKAACGLIDFKLIFDFSKTCQFKLHNIFFQFSVVDFILK